MTIGEWVRAQRKARGWTQWQMALETRISPRLIAGWERGENEPSWPNLLILCKAFGEAPPILSMEANR